MKALPWRVCRSLQQDWRDLSALLHSLQEVNDP